MKCLKTLSKFVKSLMYEVEAKALPINDARVVVKFLKSLFPRFGTPRAIISDRGTHFCNDQFAKVMSKYGVTHRLATAYHPQTSGQVEDEGASSERLSDEQSSPSPASQCSYDEQVKYEEQREGTEEKVKSTAGQIEGTKDQTEEEIASKASQTSTQTPTLMIFGDDETIATLLLNMSQAKAASKERAGIDPKDKGKKKIEEEDESESEDDDIPQAVKKFKQLESDEEMARKIQEEWEAEEERNKIAEEKATNEALIKNFDDIKARIEADIILAEKLQEQEREQFTIEEEQSSFMIQLLLRRKFLAKQRSEAIRNRPPT
ncbi:reverse transcriptase domain-containing protein [Tanacetum coccineum]